MRIHLIDSSLMGRAVQGTSASAACFAFKYEAALRFGGAS